MNHPRTRRPSVRLDFASVTASDPSLLAAEPSYAADIAPILEEFCVRCHTSEGRLDAGVELDRYESARSARVKNTCVAVSPDVIDGFADSLLPAAGHGGAIPCEPWDALSMPPGATPLLSREQQIRMARWVATGARP